MALCIGQDVSWHRIVFTILLVLGSEARPKMSNDLEKEKIMEEIKDLSSVISLIDMPIDNTPQGPEDEDDAGSGSNAVKGICRDEIKPKNATANETIKDVPDLIHANYDTLCQKVDNGTIKKLPVYLVGWELKQYCGELNNIPYKRFRMEKYKLKHPRFDIPGMCIPLKGKEMTLLMVDPDAPSRTSHRCRGWLHWMVVNIPKGNITQGKEIVSYKPPLPPYGSGPHRYFFLLYEQNYHIKEIDDSENNMAVRCGFNVRNFAEDNSLIGPVALNMFITERNRRSEMKDDKEKKENKTQNKDEKMKTVKSNNDNDKKDNSEKDQKKDAKKEAKKKDLI